MARTGEEPGPGVYTCTRCGQTVRLDDAGDRLPPCPDCRNTEFVRAAGDPAAAGTSARLDEPAWHNDRGPHGRP